MKDFDQTSQECFYDDPQPNVLKESSYFAELFLSLKPQRKGWKILSETLRAYMFGMKYCPVATNIVKVTLPRKEDLLYTNLPWKNLKFSGLKL